MSFEDLEEIDRWHVLFDELCHRNGFHDAASLASRYCKLSNGNGQQEYETVLRNMNNWRTGRHIPRLRSLRILEQVLGLDHDPSMLARWTLLYQRARQTDDDPPEIPAAFSPQNKRASAISGRLISLPMWQAAIYGCLLLGFGAVAGHIWGSGWRPWGSPADHAPMVYYKPDVYMTVGQSKIIYAERGNCGELPRDWPDVAADLPPAALGTFSDGGLARRNSKYCKGTTPARAIIYAAKRAGVDEFKIQGDYFKVTIAEAK